MNASRTAGVLATLGLGGFGLVACGPGGGYGSAGTTAGSTAAASSSSTVAAALRTASTRLGTVVVDNAGKTVYAFDKDAKNSGASACTGACAGLWPAVTTTAASPTVAGVTATIGTITRSDGTKQVTLAGRPLYTYSGDSGAGAVAGEGFKGIWWAVSPDGAEVTGSPSVAGY